jgi:Trk K+ transport system NAD-binding subunit
VADPVSRLATGSVGQPQHDTSTWTKHVVVCGLDGVGLRTVEQLHQAGVQVVAIDPAADVRRAQAAAGWGVPLIAGSPRLPQTLHDAGLWGAAAVLCVNGDDLTALETALLVRELRPDVRLAVRLANASVGEAVSGLGITVLDVAGLAAPAMVETCLRRRSHAVEIQGRRFLADSQTVERPGTLRDIYGSLSPLAVARKGEPVLLSPGRDHVLAVGDEVTLLGSEDELVEAGLRPAPGSRQLRIATGRGYATIRDPRVGPAFPRVRRVVRTGRSSVFSVFDKGVRIAIAVLALLVVLAALVLRFTYQDSGHHLDWVQSIYFTVETVATVGFGDFSFARESVWLQVFGIGLIVVGTGLVSTVFALLTNALVSRRVELSLGRSTAQTMSGHVVLVGLGDIGVRVLDGLLAAGKQVVVVEADDNNRNLGQARARHVPVVIADSTLNATLTAVQVGRADAVAVLTSNDLVNLETGLAVRTALGDRWSEVPVVLRVFDRQLARTVETQFDFTHVRSTSAIAAPFFVSAALGLDLLGGFEVSGALLLVGKLTVQPGGGLEGLSMIDLSARTRVIAIGRPDGSLEYPPRRGTRFGAGDEAYLIGPYDEMLSVLLRDQTAAPGPTG